MTSRPYLQADERRRALIEAAGRVYERDGIGGMSMVAVAAEAGVSRALVYQHFPDQATLYVALFEARAEEFVADTTAPIGLPGQEQALTAFGRVLRVPAGDLRALRTLLNVDGSPELEPVRDRLIDHLWQRWSVLFDPPRHEAIARVVILSLVSAALDYAVAVHDGVMPAEVAEEIWIAMTLGAVAKLPPA